MYMGYRHYDRSGVAPLFPFGHGLSYTSFEYGRPSLDSKVLAEDGTIELVVAVSNVGDVGGMETVQVYVRDEKSRLPRPEKELVAFEKVELDKGETKHLRIPIDKYAVGYWDTAVNKWVAEAGVFRVLVAASAEDIKYAVSFPLLLIMDAWLLTRFAGMRLRLRSRRRLPGFSKHAGGRVQVGWSTERGSQHLSCIFFLLAAGCLGTKIVITGLWPFIRIFPLVVQPRHWPSAHD
jgi:hypothetical protein